MFVPDLDEDWRFHSPYLRDGFWSCIGMPFSLMLDSKTILSYLRLLSQARRGINVIIVLFIGHYMWSLSATEAMIFKQRHSRVGDPSEPPGCNRNAGG